MTKLSDTQRRILKAASQEPKTDVREHMKDLKSPAIVSKVVESMLKHGFVIEDPDADGVSYIISDAGFAAIGKSKPETPADDDALPQGNDAEGEESSAPEPEAKAPAKKREPKPKREGASKKQTMIDMLSRPEGATIHQLMDSIGWQKHSVHGAMANLKKELQEKHGQTITGTKGDGEDRVYKIA